MRVLPVHVQGSAHLYGQLQSRLTQQLQSFERIALHTSLNIPAGLILQACTLLASWASWVKK